VSTDTSVVQNVTDFGSVCSKSLLQKRRGFFVVLLIHFRQVGGIRLMRYGMTIFIPRS